MQASLKSGCEEHFGLLADFSAAVRELMDLHEQQFRAIVQGDTECSRFEVLIHMAKKRSNWLSSSCGPARLLDR